jgi:glycosyltransferase involved in cell wall biosynthesis
MKHARPHLGALGRLPGRGRERQPFSALRACHGVRILLANPYFLPFHGGIEARIDGLAKGLAQRGHDVAVLTAQLPGTLPHEERDGFEVVRCPAVTLPNVYNPPPLVTRHVEREAKAWGADVIDLHYRWAPEWSHALRSVGQRTPLVVTWHNAWGEGQGLVGWLSQQNDVRFAANVLPLARRVICISQFVQRDLERRGVPAGKLVHVPPGFDVPPEPEDRERDGEAVFVGRLVATKGLPTLLEAVQHAPEARVAVCGQGPERAALEQRARRLGVQGRVRFAGYVSHAEKEQLLRRAPFLAHPAWEEALGHAVAEAMLLGCPVVGTQVGGLPEVVGEGGVLVPPRDARALAEAMLRMLRDPGLARALGAKARQHAAQFTWPRCVERTERVYQEAVGSAWKQPFTAAPQAQAEPGPSPRPASGRATGAGARPG